MFLIDVTTLHKAQFLIYFRSKLCSALHMPFLFALKEFKTILPATSMNQDGALRLPLHNVLASTYPHTYIRTCVCVYVRAIVVIKTFAAR